MVFILIVALVPERKRQPRQYRTDTITVDTESVNQSETFHDVSSREISVSQIDNQTPHRVNGTLVCNVCGRDHGGPRRVGCEGPGQKMVSREDYARKYSPRLIPSPRLDRATFRAQRAAAKLAAKSEASDWGLL